MSKNNGDGRKKIFDTESITSYSTSSKESNFELLDRPEELKHKKRILSIGISNKILNPCGNEIRIFPDEFDDHIHNNELNSYDSEHRIDKDYE